MRFAAVLMPVFFLCTSVAFAQSEVEVSRTINSEALKSVSKARNIAAINTLMPMGTGLAAVSLFDDPIIQRAGAITTIYGLMVGPATGHFYASDYKRGLIGIAGRALGGFLMIEATRKIFGNNFGDALDTDKSEVSLSDRDILTGELLIIGSIIYNFWQVQTSVQEYNSQGIRNMQVSLEAVKGRTVPVLTARFNL